MSLMFAQLIALNAAAFAASPQQDSKVSTTVTIEKKVVRGEGQAMVEEQTTVGTASAQCGDGRRFEASGSGSTGDKASKIKMVVCGGKSDSAADWAKKLKDARGKVAEMDSPAGLKTRILAEFDAEIDRSGR